MKRNRHFLLLLTVAILVVAFSSFSKGKKKKPFKGYKKIENGSYFLLNVKGTGATAVDTGGAVFAKIKFKTIEDSVFFDINEQTHVASYPLRVDAFRFKGDFLDIFSRLHTGDSVSFFVRMDSLKKYYEEEFKFEPQYDTMEYLGFAVKVDSVYSREKVQGLRAAAEAEQEKQKAMILKMKEEEPAAILKYIADNKISEKPTESGLYYLETKKGTGEKLKDDQEVSIHYTGKFIAGEVFDTSVGHEPLVFILGQHMVIQGMEEALLLMNNGGKATFIIPSSLAYGDGGGRMKPFATLIFDVEIISVKDVPAADPR
ncbi:MAG: FKBP-type peptidyl-prolyl cis-trans isomerase [Bacteroidota bacterium]|nr:FKBP-type peptidyl-prolyl cis-trans isomerase [Bacteroidota bacterium]